MKLQKPSWINHDGHPIFSVDIHPTSPRFATGGQGADSMGRVVIWGMGSIEHAGPPGEMPKFLCQLDHHNACVNCVRWSNKGKYLASGGDDKVIMIWELKGYPALTIPPSNQIHNSVFGKTAQEIWKPIFTLRYHTGDILDLAWSPDDRYLASASVDNKVIIWDAHKFPRMIKEIQGHTSLVKGVTWDPVGSYLATQSDDQSLKIWRTSDWVMEHDVTESFVECGGTTHVLRLDWSPDGGYIVSAHAMNGGGPTAQIVERDGWKADKDFVGHRKAVVCVRFTRTMLQKGKSQMCYVALGSRDRAMSIWSTSLKRPLVVIRDVFTTSVMDLAWSSDAKIMMGCSGDGTVVVATFTREEIGDPLTQEEMNLEFFLARKKLEEAEAVKAETEKSSPTPIMNEELQSSHHHQHQPPGNTRFPDVIIKGPTDKQIETRTKDGKRRITPKFLLPQNEVQCPAFKLSEEIVFGETRVASAPSVNLRNNMVSGIEEVRTLNETAPHPNPVDKIDASNNDGDPSSFIKKRIVPITLNHSGINGTTTGSSPVAHVNGSSSLSQNGDSSITPPTNVPENKSPKLQNNEPVTDEKLKTAIKRKRDSEESPPPSLIPPKKMIKPSCPLEKEPKPNNISNNTNTVVKRPTTRLPSDEKARFSVSMPPMKITEDKTQTKVDGSGVSYCLTVVNGYGATGTNWLKCQHESNSFEGLSWAISTAAPICSVFGTINSIAAACEDCSVHILDVKGRFVSPPFLLSGLPTKFLLKSHHLVIVTVKLKLDIWDLLIKKRILKNESVLPILRLCGKDVSPDSFEIDLLENDGAPVIKCSNGKSFRYSFQLQTWTAVSRLLNQEKPSTFGHSRRTAGLCVNSSILTDVKIRLAEAIELNDSIQEVEEAVVMVAKTFAEKGMKRELRTICQDLLNPIQSKNAGDFASLLPITEKLKVLREILNFLLKNLKWQDFYVEFDELLKISESTTMAMVVS